LPAAICLAFYDGEQTFARADVCAALQRSENAPQPPALQDVTSWKNEVRIAIPDILLCMRTKVSEKGQITVPKRLRERLGIRAGDQLELTEEDGRLVAHKAVTGDPVAGVYGLLDTTETSDEAIRNLRGTPDAI
jgi:antitoxin PrlF